MNEKSAIGLRIKEARKLAGLSQEKLAGILGISFQSVQQWERGLTTPRSNLMPALATATNRTPEWIQFGAPAETKEVQLLSAALRHKIYEAHKKSIDQCVRLGWLDISRKDVSYGVLADVFYAKLIEELGTVSGS